jgi:hypothetical protein
MSSLSPITDLLNKTVQDKPPIRHCLQQWAKLGGLYLAIIRDRYGGSKTALTIALPGDLYLLVIIDHILEHT